MKEPELNLPTYPFVMFGVPVIAGLVIHFFWDIPVMPDLAASVAGAVLLVIGGVIGLWAIYTMVSQGEHPEPGKGTNKIISNGPFRFSRNPSYVALVLSGTGFGLVLNSAAVLICVPIGFAILALWVVPAEEKYLSAILTDQYETYRARVRRWL